MNPKRISLFLIAAGVLAVLVLLMLSAVYAPALAADLRGAYADMPGIDGMYWLGLVGVWTASLILLLALWEYFRVSVRIGKDQSFCQENVASLRRIAVYLWVGGALWLGAIFAPGVLFRFPVGPAWILFLLIAMAHCALGLLVWSLSRLLARAVEIKQENDFTV